MSSRALGWLLLALALTAVLGVLALARASGGADGLLVTVAALGVGAAALLVVLDERRRRLHRAGLGPAVESLSRRRR